MKRHGSFHGSRVRTGCESAYEPKTRDDLVVNKNRVKDVSDWLDSALQATKASILLVNGPAGCGKTATVRVLAAEKGMQAVDWVTPADTFECWSETEDLKPVNVTIRFKNFLFGVGRYSSVLVENNGTIRKKLVIVKDFPLSLLSAPDEFREVVELYVSRSTSPIVFICTDSVNKKNKDIAYELFTDSFKQKHNITQVSFSNVAVTLVVKALKRIVQITKWGVQDELIRQIAEECSGDIRKAVNNLSVVSVGGKYRCISNSRSNRSQDAKKTNQKSSKNADTDPVGLFHAVGRVLYAKREISQSQDSSSDFRGEFVHMPMDIVREYSHYAVPFISLAHCNYLDIFSSIDSISKAADYLSVADVIMAEWRDKEILTSIGFGVAVSGLMDSNNDPVRKWKPLKGSQWNEDLKTASINHFHIQELFSDYSSAKLDVYLDFLPLITQMWFSSNPGANFARCKFGFLPHSTSSLLESVRKIKSDTISLAPKETEFLQEDEKDEVDYEISEDSE